MLKAYVLGMQSLAWEGVDSLLQGGGPGNRSNPGPYTGSPITVPNMRQVHTDLVRTASFERETHETYRPPGFYHLVVGAGSTTVALDNGHLLPLLGMASNRCLHSALQCWEAATHQRHIAPLQLAGLQLC